MNNIKTILFDLPGTIRSYVIKNDYDSYTVVLNAKLNKESQLEAYIHELQHISNGDFDKCTKADLIEIVAHA